MKLRLPHLSATAKAQLWGLCVGGSTAFYAVYKLEYGMGLFLIGSAAAWIAGEALFGKRLINQSDAGAIALGVASGLAFPWIGFLVSAAFALLRP